MRNMISTRGLSAIGSAAIICGLCLGAAVPARAQSDSDSRISQENSGDNGRSGDARDDDSARKQALHRRTLARSGRDFDPKVYEARGRELQGEYYEITTMANPPSWAATGNSAATSSGDGSESLEPQGKSHNFWVWAGAVGLASAAGAVAGYFVWDHNQAPTQPRDVSIPLNDKP